MSRERCPPRLDLSKVRSPKLVPNGSSARWYPYYAGYSEAFVEDLLAALKPAETARVFDPWNGSGTTTFVARRRGFDAYGTDLNPALVMIGRSRLVPADIAPSLAPLGDEITAVAKRIRYDCEDDPLRQWFSTGSAAYLRRLDLAIRQVLVPGRDDSSPSAVPIRHASPLAAFFYAALFRTVRQHLAAFRSSNPTWIRVARSDAARLATPPSLLARNFRLAVESLAAQLDHASEEAAHPENAGRILLADSRRLPHAAKSFDLVVTSPPYCTRIDYAIATLPELACLGFDRSAVSTLRSQLLGRPSFASHDVTQPSGRSPYAANLLEQVRTHQSKASATYYYRFFASYVHELSQSLAEIVRVSKTTARIALVVQDSFYKNIHISLPTLVREVMDSHGWQCQSRHFPVPRTMASINPHSRREPGRQQPQESLLVFSHF